MFLYLISESELLLQLLSDITSVSSLLSELILYSFPCCSLFYFENAERKSWFVSCEKWQILRQTFFVQMKPSASVNEMFVECFQAVLLLTHILYSKLSVMLNLKMKGAQVIRWLGPRAEQEPKYTKAQITEPWFYSSHFKAFDVLCGDLPTELWSKGQQCASHGCMTFATSPVRFQPAMSNLRLPRSCFLVCCWMKWACRSCRVTWPVVICNKKQSRIHVGAATWIYDVIIDRYSAFFPCISYSYLSDCR